jgi:hypothetical protein
MDLVSHDSSILEHITYSILESPREMICPFLIQLQMSFIIY